MLSTQHRLEHVHHRADWEHHRPVDGGGPVPERPRHLSQRGDNKNYPAGSSSPGNEFGSPSSKILAALQKVDHATVVVAASGTKAPSATPRQGTLLLTRPVNGAATIYVVGTDGELHGFVSPTQFKRTGYDAALVVTVPSLRGLKVGAERRCSGGGWQRIWHQF